MTTAPRSLLLLLIALLASADVCAQAGPRRRDPSADRAADSVRRVERETGGEVLRAEPMQRSGHEVYRLKVLTPEGRVRVMQDDPRERGDRVSRAELEAERQRAQDRRRESDDEPSGHY